MYIYINTIIASISPAHDLLPLHTTTSLMKIPFMEMNMLVIQGQHPASTLLRFQACPFNLLHTCLTADYRGLARDHEEKKIRD